MLTLIFFWLTCFYPKYFYKPSSYNYTPVTRNPKNSYTKNTIIILKYCAIAYLTNTYILELSPPKPLFKFTNTDKDFHSSRPSSYAYSIRELHFFKMIAHFKSLLSRLICFLEGIIRRTFLP